MSLLRNISDVTCLNQSENGTNLMSANETDNDGYEDFYNKAQFITGLFLYPIVCLFGLTGNVISIFVLSQRKMATSTNTFLTALAVSDGIKLVNDSFYFLVILLLNVNAPLGQKAYGYMYPYAHYFFNMSVCITAWLTVSVAAERYILVCHATRAREWCSIYRARMTSVAVFVSMSLLTIPLGLRYQTVRTYDDKLNTTVLSVEVTELWKNENFVTAYTWIQNLLRSIVPLLVLCTLNYFIVQALRRTQGSRKKISSRHRVTLMLISVIVVFMLCVTPDAIMSAFFGYGYYEARFLVRGVREITDLLLTVNSAVNFILYYTFNNVFRRNFYALFCKNCNSGMMAKDELYGRRSSFVTVKNATSNSRQQSKNSRSTGKKDNSPQIMMEIKRQTTPLIENDYTRINHTIELSNGQTCI